MFNESFARPFYFLSNVPNVGIVNILAFAIGSSQGVLSVLIPKWPGLYSPLISQLRPQCHFNRANAFENQGAQRLIKIVERQHIFQRRPNSKHMPLPSLKLEEVSRQTVVTQSAEFSLRFGHIRHHQVPADKQIYLVGERQGKLTVSHRGAKNNPPGALWS